MRAALPVDYVALEAANRSLGLAGEQRVLDYERARLVQTGRDGLAERIEHTSVAEGDGAGFDLRSFEPDGTDRFIEVKTTRHRIETPFYASRNEVDASGRLGGRYHVHRLFTFATDPGLHVLSGAIPDTCFLSAATFVARPLSLGA